MNYYLLDLAQFFVINSSNLLISAIFISRVKKARFERILGILNLVLGIPTVIIIIINLIFQREWWFWIIPSLFLIFLFFELIVDYIRKIQFRNPRNKRILVPYLILYYSSIILMWGLTWTIGLLYGVITGITYFIELGCAIYAGKHGVG
ncbi:MAG: hypothetical protein ACFFDF_02080 [Candidatus Odinarchaeota archaeon]